MGSSNTNTLQNTIDFTTFYLGRRPLAIGGANTIEPALTAANIVQATILAPPFKWPWNRSAVTFVQPTTDTPQSLPLFGFIEKAFVTNSAGAINQIPNVKMELTLDAGSGQPTTVGVYLDDNNGNITFRFLPGLPDDPLNQITIIYQKRMQLMTALANVWTIPDCFSHIYTYGFMALMQLFADDTRFTASNAKFIGSLLAVAEGLSEQDQAIFMEQWTNVLASQVRAGARLQQGFQGRNQ